MSDAQASDGVPGDAMYRELVLEEYKHPRNKGRLAHPTHEARVRNPLCGDELILTLSVQGDVVSDVRFEGVGCAISQASASLFTDHVKGRRVSEVLSMDEREIVRLLGFAPNPMRMKCAVLALRGVADALEKGGSDNEP